MNRRPFHYAYYLLPVLAVLILLLLINGYFEIQRTRAQLFNLLETEGQLLIRGIETNADQSDQAFSGRRPSVVGHGPSRRAWKRNRCWAWRNS